VDIVMDAFVAPFSMGHRGADSHWESFGRIAGEIRVDGAITRIAGLAFQDRSWGARDLSSLLGMRIATAIFDENLVFRLFQMTRSDGHTDYGFMIDSGQFYELAGMQLDVVVGTDGLSVKSIDVALWTKNGRGYRLTGRVEASDPCIGREGFFS